MAGLFFLLSVVAVGLVVMWMVRNDRVRPDGPTAGLFAMPDEMPAQKRRGQARRARRQPPVTDDPEATSGRTAPRRPE